MRDQCCSVAECYEDHRVVGRNKVRPQHLEAFEHIICTSKWYPLGPYSEVSLKLSDSPAGTFHDCCIAYSLGHQRGCQGILKIHKGVGR